MHHNYAESIARAGYIMLAYLKIAATRYKVGRRYHPVHPSSPATSWAIFLHARGLARAWGR